MVSLTGFGRSGPKHAEPAYDYLLQALAGYMSLTGEPDDLQTRRGHGLERMEELHQEYADDGLRVLAVDILEDPKRVRHYFEAEGVTFPVLLDQHGTYAFLWDIQVIPTYILVSREGVEVARIEGYGEEELDDLETEILSQID